MHLRSVLVAGVAAAACGESGGSSVTIKGQSYSFEDAISNAAPVTAGSSSTAAAILIGSATNLCADLNAKQQPKNLAGLVMLVSDVNTSTGATSAPTAPGTYTIAAGNAQARQAYVSFLVTDANCHEITAQEATGASGTVTLTSVNDGAYAGDYDVTFDSNDHVTGTFSTSNCAGISAVFSGSNNTCI